MNLQLDALAEHVRDLVWENLGTELQLVTCQQGCPEHLRAPEDVLEAVPAVLVDPPRWGGARPDTDLPMISGTVTLGLQFLRRVQGPTSDSPGEEHPRTTVRQLERIAALFCQPGWRLEGWDDSAGVEVLKIWPSDVVHEYDLDYDQGKIQVALGSITLQAEVTVYSTAG